MKQVLLLHIVNVFKLATVVVYSSCIVYFDLWDSYAAWLLFATHGTYGVLWASKTWLGYPNKKVEVPAPLWYMFATVFALTMYWLPISMIIINRPILPPGMAALAVILFGLGIYFHFIADLHKNVFIQHREMLSNIQQQILQGGQEGSKTSSEFQNVSVIVPKMTFLRTKLFSIARNPNYFGELLVYLSFAVCSMSVYPALYLLFMMFVVWLPNMKKKDDSLSRFGDEYSHYLHHTAKFIPFIW